MFPPISRAIRPPHTERERARTTFNTQAHGARAMLKGTQPRRMASIVHAGAGAMHVRTRVKGSAPKSRHTPKDSRVLGGFRVFFACSGAALLSLFKGGITSENGAFVAIRATKTQMNHN